MTNNKKIVLFISHIYGDYQKNLCRGVIEYAAIQGYQTEIYTTSDGEDVGQYSIGENSILRVPNYSEICGVIVASDTYLNSEFKDSIINSVRTNSNCPIIEVTSSKSDNPTVSLENSLPVGSLTEHLINTHGYTSLCFLGCSTESSFSDRRLSIFRETLKKHNIICKDKYVASCDYTSASVKTAMEQFLCDGQKPDAIVCYNDRIALLLMAELIKFGLNVPHDIAIVGCDEIMEGQSIDPTLTTISFPVYDTGSVAVQQLLHIINNEPFEQCSVVNAAPVIGSSCGCVHRYKHNQLLFSNKLKHKIERLESSTFSSMRMSANFSHVSDINEGMDLLEEYVSTIPGCNEFYLCLYSNWDAISKPLLEMTGIEYDEQYVDDTMYLKFAYRNGERLDECSFAKTSLLPSGVSSSSNHVISPLYFENREFGYIVMAFENNVIEYPFYLVQWFMNITSMLQSLCEAKRAKLMQDKLIDIYLKDSLTGLYNRHGYELKLEEMLKNLQDHQSVTAFVIDMDYLKKINDIYGHAEGDFGIHEIGSIISRLANSNMLCTRTGGDEFSVLASNMSDAEALQFTKEIQTYLDEFNSKHIKEYTLSASIGYVTFEYINNQTNISDYVKIADEKMYANKKAKKAARE